MQKTESLYREVLDIAAESALAHLENIDQMSVAPAIEPATLRARLAKPLSNAGMDAERVVSELIRDTEGSLVASPGGRFFGWVIGGTLPAAIAADWLASAWDQNAGLYATSPAAAIVEEVAGAWLKEILGIPAHASFALVTGCQMAHVTCIAAARHAVLARRGWDVEASGLYGAPSIRILSSDQRHGTFDRALRLLGLGPGRAVYLPADEQGRLEPSALELALAGDPGAPTIVLLQAGDVNIGAYDPFETLIPIAKSFNAWVHVDGAFGLWAAACPRLRPLVRGVEKADSWATDGHKWLNVPFDCGYAFVADPDSHRASMSHRAPYLTHAAEARDQLDWTPEWSRRARGIPTYAALRQLGRDGVAALIDRCCRHAHSIVRGIGNLPGAEVVWEPVINQGLVRFLDNRPGATDEDHDRRTNEVIGAICATGEAFFGGTTWRGRRAMRVSVSSWRTTDEDVKRVIRAVASVLQGLPR